VHTYAEGLGWDGLNLVSTIGAFVLATGVLLVLIDVLLHLRLAGKVDANVWGASTLEWLPADDYGVRSIPHINSREPLWDRPELAQEVDRGQHYLPCTATGGRETIVTSPIDARPQYILIVPGWSFLPLIAGAGTAAFFLFLTVKMVVPAFIGGLVALAAIFRWMWDLDRGVTHPPVDIGGGIRLPVYASGSVTHSWWAMIVLILVDATVFASLVFSYFYLWTVTQATWPPSGTSLPASEWPVIAALGWLASSGLFVWARRALESGQRGPAGFRMALVAAVALMLAAFGVDLYGIWSTGLRPDAHAYGAAVYAVAAWQGLHGCVLFVMTGYTLARSWSGLLDSTRRVTFDNTRLLWHYMVAQGIAGILLVHAFPRWLS
jgi:cytochrome c oxidase subunit I+III